MESKPEVTKKVSVPVKKVAAKKAAAKSAVARKGAAKKAATKKAVIRKAAKSIAVRKGTASVDAGSTVPAVAPEVASEASTT